MSKKKPNISTQPEEKSSTQKKETQELEQFKEDDESTNPLKNSGDFDDSTIVVNDIDQPLLNILDRWFQSYLRIITFLGAASGIVLLYVGVNLIQVINDAEKDNSERENSEMQAILKKSHEKTNDTVKTIQDTTNVYTDKHIEHVSLYNIIKKNRSYIKFGIVFLTISLLSTILCVLTTYNWYISGVSNILKDARSEEYLERLIQDKLKYRNKEVIGNMWFWGQISLYSGWLTGLTLGIGVFTYAYGVWEVISELLHI